MDFYEIKIGKISRKLPLVPVGKNIRIASFNLLGDAEIVQVLADIIYRKVKNLDFDYFVGPEVKVVPLMQVLTDKLGRSRYIVCRKNIHAYMVSPIKSTIGDGLVLDGRDVQFIKGKKVIVIDDVVTSGNTLMAVEDLLEKSKAKLVCHLAIFKQGDKAVEVKGKIVILNNLPLFAS